MKKQLPKYLDSASTTPVDSRVLAQMSPYFMDHFGNASSNHSYGKTAKLAIDLARNRVSNIIGSAAAEIYFTSGATESINWALKGYIEANSDKGNHIITVKTEHKAVLETCEYLETKGTEVTYLDVDVNGLISLNELNASIKENTSMICVMHVNNEIGIIQDIKSIGQIAKENDICFFCDATQAVGKVPVDVVDNNIDMLCLSAHKMNGPKGIGVLYKKRGIQLTSLIHGGGQEDGLRAGTSNTPLIVGMGMACKLADDEFESNVSHLIEKRTELEMHYENNDIGVVNFKEVNRAPHIISITLNSIEAEDYLILKRNEFVASTGSACNTELMEPSHVLRAMHKNGIKKVVRISLNESQE